MIIQKYTCCDFSHLKTIPWNTICFTIVFRAAVRDLPDGNFIDNHDGFSIRTRCVCRSDFNDAAARSNNYFFKNSRCRVIEVSAVFAEEDAPYVIGFPLYLAGNDDTEHEFAVTYDGVWLSIYCDGILYDRDSPHGGALASSAEPVSYGINAVISGGSDGIEKIEKTNCVESSVYCYTPVGFNTWIGDVVVSSFRGVFHIFYLHDRHHHTGRKGRGAHIFCHLSSSDFVNWIDHGETITFDKPYLTVGTGNSFVLDDRLYLAFGWHTERSKPENECAAALLKKRFAASGRVESVAYSDLGKMYPSGASYAVSDDGVDFTYSNKIIHYVENPNITVMPDGTLRLCEYGIWKGRTLDCWELTDPDFPPRLRSSLCLNTTECPSFFTLNGTEYLMIGFTGFYRHEADGSWHDLVEDGLDFYDGMAVPMAVEHDGRVIAGAWMNTPEWGSFLMLRELIALDNGGVGSRWVAETLPEGDFLPLTEGAFLNISPDTRDTKIELQATDKCVICFSGTGKSCYLVIDAEKQCAAWLSSPEDQVEFFRDIVRRRPDAESFRDLAGEPVHVWGANYARKVILPQCGFALRIIVRNEAKLHGSFIDAEIDSKYTFATYRRDLKSVACVTSF